MTPEEIAAAYFPDSGKRLVGDIVNAHHRKELTNLIRQATEAAWEKGKRQKWELADASELPRPRHPE